MKTKILFLVFVLLIISFELQAQHDPFQLSIDVYKADSVLKAHVGSDHSVIIFDIRTPGEYANGYIDGAINHNYYGPGFDDTLKNLDKEKEYLIYCASGGRSNGAFSKMKTLGFRMVYNMLGGVNAWRSAGFKLVTGGTGIDVITNNVAIVSLFPNPVSAGSKFVNDEQYLPVRIQVLNLQGQSVKQIDVEPGMSKYLESDQLKKGVYFFQVFSEGILIQNGKFIKN